MNIQSKSTPPNLKYDGKIAIAVGRSRKATEWKNREMQWSDLVDKLRDTTRTRETVEEYKKLPKSQQDEIKDVGGFVGGTLKGGRRTAVNVAWRQIVTLDADFAGPDFWPTATLIVGDASALVYSTHKHEPVAGKCRLRLVFPLNRPVNPDEYQAIARRIAADISIDLFDSTTYEPHRLMYWPSTPTDGEFLFEFQDGPWMDADEVLARYDDWRDQALWPEPAKAEKDRKRLADKQGDPLLKPGVIGAFCRTYSVVDVLEQFLSDVYEPCATEGRYTYKEGTASGGLILYEDKFAFSHHGTDPISGKLVNAFDLYRLHKFGELDEAAEPGTPVSRLPSYLAMIEYSTKDSSVKRTLGEERLAEANADFDVVTDNNWLEKLEVNKTGQYISTAHNVILILSHDPNVAGKIALDDFAHRIVIKDDLPWRKLDRGSFWSDADDSGLRNYLSKVYTIKGQGIIIDALSEVLLKNAYHPVREYLTGLEWDGIERIDSLLIDYLGAIDSPYTRAVTRKMLVAAVARASVPGIKFDNVLVMVGPQGVGKSYILKLLGQKWHSDSINTVIGKEAFEQLQGAWLIELAELSATRKAEAEAVKHFISKQEDAYRVAYGRQISVFPRQCVFFGTTNDTLFLRDKTGNRRFWPVEVGGAERTKNLWKDMTKHEINQIWAEAVDAWQSGETLYLGTEMEQQALEVQDKHVEESPMAGVVREYLDRLLPDTWEQMDIAARRNFIHNRDFGEAMEGTEQRQRVCVMEIWVELYEGSTKQLTNMASREINDILKKTKGWRPHVSANGTLRFGNLYGRQRAFIRI
ncbi:virulence-associated E family protein [Pelosinus sp. IPA-1]|uniref:virulence-associated E family protein n=1 Tax=Pelosinus sp. IPA-1 TaxID=3029569 RepID=UPI0024361FD9|nr:virulence-associated E family protein [Pelosinus sp. IPA-1]GMB00903.1 hypothetical protein PIPA1_37020 [Pelosinus sp. IPA-1]